MLEKYNTIDIQDQRQEAGEGEKDVKIKCCRISAAKKTSDNMEKILKDRKLNI